MRATRHIPLLSAVFTSIAATGYAAPAEAQDTSPGTVASAPAVAAPDARDAPQDTSTGLADIVVTAERRATNVQQTPLSITALEGGALRANGVTNIEGLAGTVPNVSFSRIAADARVYIRGVGYDSTAPGGEPRVAVYNDGIYQPRPQAAFSGFYDVDRVEVLRGPQGTLYGRNAVAGAINVISRNPTDTLQGFVSGTVGNYGLIGTEGGIGGPLGDGVSGRISFRTADRSGFGRNIETDEEVDDQHTRDIRAKLKIEASNTLTFQLQANYGRQKDNSGGYRYLGFGRPDVVPLVVVLGVAPTNPRDTAGRNPDNFLEYYGTAGMVTWRPAGGTEISLITGYNFLNSRFRGNDDGTTARLVADQRLNERSKAFSQEVRLNQELGTLGSLFAGLYYFRENNTAENFVGLNGVGFGLPNQIYQGFGTVASLRTRAYAAYAQADLDLTSKFGISLGGRYSHEDKSIEEAAQFDLTRLFDVNNPLIPFGEAQQNVKQSSFDPKATLKYKFTDRIFGYATYSRGFKSGGFNAGGLQPPFQAERLTNYEVGIKSDLFDRRLRANISAFYYDYQNLQVNVNEGVALITRNAAKARVKGVEGEFVILPVDDLRLSINAAYLDSEYLNFITIEDTYPELGLQSLAGNQLNNAPKFKFNTDIGYTFHANRVDITPRVDVIWSDRVYFSQFNRIQNSQPPRTQINLFLGLEIPGTGWSANAFVRNLTNDTYIVSSYVASLYLNPSIGQYGDPRTFGVRITKVF